jgi:predicted DNA-binding protein
MSEKLDELDYQLDEMSADQSKRSSGAYIKEMTEAKAFICALLAREAQLLEIAKSLRMALETEQRLSKRVESQNEMLMDRLLTLTSQTNL